MSVLVVGHIYPEKVFSAGEEKISRNPNPHQIEPKYRDFNLSESSESFYWPQIAFYFETL